MFLAETVVDSVTILHPSDHTIASLHVITNILASEMYYFFLTTFCIGKVSLQRMLGIVTIYSTPVSKYVVLYVVTKP